MSNIKISVVMPHYRRAKLLDTTLFKYVCTQSEDVLVNVEFIIVDDSGNKDLAFWEVIKRYENKLIIKAFSIGGRTINPVIPFNVGIRQAEGSIIILTCPECFPSPRGETDILKTIYFRMEDNVYLSCACFSLNQRYTKEVHETSLVYHDMTLGWLPSDVSEHNRAATFNGDLGWYNHGVYAPRYLNWCAAVRREHLLEIRGFDEDYAAGWWYDDDDLRDRLIRKGLVIVPADDLVVFHQWHYDENYKNRNKQELINRNKKLYELKKNAPIIRNDENWGKPKKVYYAVG